MKGIKTSNIRYPIEVGFYNTISLTDEDREFLRGRMLFFNYLVEQVEHNSQKLDNALKFIEECKQLLRFQNKGKRTKNDKLASKEG